MCPCMVLVHAVLLESICMFRADWGRGGEGGEGGEKGRCGTCKRQQWCVHESARLRVGSRRDMCGEQGEGVATMGGQWGGVGALNQWGVGRRGGKGRCSTCQQCYVHEQRDRNVG